MSYNIVQAAAGFGNSALGCGGLGCGGRATAGLGAAIYNPYARGVAVNTRISATDPKLSLIGRVGTTVAPAVSWISSDAVLPGAAPAAEDDTLFYVGVVAAAVALLGGVWYFTQ